MSDRLVAFVLARCDDSERIALATQMCGCGHCTLPLEWTIENGIIHPIGVEVEHTSAPGYINPEQAAYIVHCDPATELREIEAKRRIVALHERSDCQGHYGPWISCDEAWCTYRCTECISDGFPCQTLRLLALTDASHPDYRQEWRP